MSTTSTYSGLNEESRKVFKVQAPPGGRSSNIFGTDPEPEQAHYGKKQIASPNRDSHNVLGNDRNAPTTMTMCPEIPPPRPAGQQHADPMTLPPAGGSSQHTTPSETAARLKQQARGAYNPITGADY